MNRKNRKLVHALALLENGWTVRGGKNGDIAWRSPRGLSGDDYLSASLDNPPQGVIDDAVSHQDYLVSA